MSDPINGDLKVILTHLDYIRSDIKAVHLLIKEGQDHDQKQDKEIGTLKTDMTLVKENQDKSFTKNLYTAIITFIAMIGAMFARDYFK